MSYINNNGINSKNKYKADLGIIGLGIMGANLARNFARNQYLVSLYNRSIKKIDIFRKNYDSEGSFIYTKSLGQFIFSLKNPKIIILMIKSGRPIDYLINKLLKFNILSKNDVIVDAGNSHYEDTKNRINFLFNKKNINFAGVGISGGEDGALFGPSIMPSGSHKIQSIIEPKLKKIAAKVNGNSCCHWISQDGSSGHFIKMVHNGIEYACMQAISEIHGLFKYLNISPKEQSNIFSSWNEGKLSSYLLEITSKILLHCDHRTKKPIIDVVSDIANQKGTGYWTISAAMKLNIDISTISESVFVRSLSTSDKLRSLLSKNTIIKPINKLNNTKEIKHNIDHIYNALYLTMLIIYTQGFAMLFKASIDYNWNLNLYNIAMLWRDGCIIRASLLEKILEIYQKINSTMTNSAVNIYENLMLSSEFQKEFNNNIYSLRKVLIFGIKNKIPLPVISTSLSYYDMIHSSNLCTNLIQCQRDFFGAHTYKRNDIKGNFHTLWNKKNKKEIKIEES